MYPNNISSGRLLSERRLAFLQLFSLKITKFLITWMILEMISIHKRIE